MSASLIPLGTYATGVFDEGAAEINAYDPASKRLFVVNSDATTLDILDLTDPTNLARISTIDASQFGGGANSVAVKNGVVAVAIEAETATDNGLVVFFNAETQAVLGQVTVGALPDMVTFTPDGTKVLVANEGEPSDDYTIDPEGSISIIDISGGVNSDALAITAGFDGFNDDKAQLINQGVRIFGPNLATAVETDTATVAQDLEPEYIAVSPDGTQAFVTLQENNAVAVVDINDGEVDAILPLGTKDFSLPGNGFDASNRDGGINIQNWPVLGLYQPDAIAAFTANNQNYYITANEGDARDYDGFSEEARLGDDEYILEPQKFNGTQEQDAAILKLDENLGRLKVTTASGDDNRDGDYLDIFAYGGRSFSIWDGQGNQVFDSGDQFEQILAQQLPADFNSTNDENGSFDDRSDDKGPEPEGVTVGVVDGRTYAFIGLERVGGIMVYDVTDPAAPTFERYVNNRDFAGDAEAGTAGDLGPEGLTFISAEDSPNDKPLLAVSNEVSGTTTLYEFVPNSFTLELLHAGDQEGGAAAIQDAPRFSAVLNALRGQDLGNDGVEDNTLVLSSGDAFIPGLFFDASASVFGSPGIADIQIQNELGFQAIALGNHEFDTGTADLAALIEGSAEGSIFGADFAGANFPYLSANLDVSTDANLAPLETAGGAAPQPNTVTSSVVIDVNGENIGVVGATTPTLASISSPGDVSISPSPFDPSPTAAQLDALAAEIQAEVDALLAADSSLNKVVLLAHMQQLSIEEALAERLENVDIIVAGGSNTRLFDSNDRPRNGDSSQGEYPKFIANAGGTQTAVVNTDGSYKYVGRLVIDFDAAGNIVPSSYDENVSGAYATDAQGVADLGAQNLVDPEVEQIADAIEAEIIATESNVFGVSDVFLNGNRSGTGTADDPDGVRTQETNLGNLTADANLAAAKAIDPTVVVSIKNGGGIRASMGQTVVPPGGTEAVRSPNEAVVDSNGNIVKPEGGISQNDIATTLAFNNDLTLLTLTRAELVAVLEHGVGALPDVSGRFLQVSGVELSFDPDLAEGDRIQNAIIQDEAGNLVAELVRDGEISGDPAETFRIVTLGFLASPRFDDAGAFTGGGDGYPFPNTNTDAAEGEVVDTSFAARVNTVSLEQEGVTTGDATFADDGTEQDALAEYLNDNFLTTPFNAADGGPATDERIQNLNFRQDTVGLPDDETPVILPVDPPVIQPPVIQPPVVQPPVLSNPIAVSIRQGQTATVNELVFIPTDDAEGRLNGILPGEAGYQEALVAGATVLFSTLATDDSFPGLTTDRVVPLGDATNFQFALIEGGSLDSVRNSAGGTVQLANTVVTADALQPGANITLPIQLSTGETSVVLNTDVAATTPPLGSGLQGQSAESELLDFRGMTGTTTATFEIFREAAFNNVVGFFSVENKQGQVRDELGVLLSPGDEGYARAAMQNRLTNAELTTDNGTSSTFTTEIELGGLLSTFIIANGTVSQVLDGSNTNVYFTHIGANSDGEDHVRLLGNNVFGFEDLPSGGDLDFDDIIVKATFA